MFGYFAGSFWLEVIGTSLRHCCCLEIDICRAMEISTGANAEGVLGDSDSGVGIWWLIRAGDREVGRLEDRCGRTRGEEVEEGEVEG